VQKEVHCTAQLDHLPFFCLALTESSTQATKAERGAAGPVKLCSVLPFALLEEGVIRYWCLICFQKVKESNVALSMHFSHSFFVSAATTGMFDVLFVFQ
jgi:hypothetical protein